MRLKHLLSVFLTLLTLSVGQVWGANSGLTASAGTFVIDFYDDTKLTSSSGTGLTNSNYSSFVKVGTGLTNTNVVTAVSVTGTVRYGMNGGLTAGTGTAAAENSHYVTFTTGTNFPVRKATVYATAYETGRWKLNSTTASSGFLGNKGATFANVSNPLIWNFSTYTNTLTFKKDNGSNNGTQKRLTIYTIVCEYGYRATFTQPSEGSISATPKTANENGAGWNSTLGAVVGLKSTQKVTLSATAPNNKEFDHWTVKKTASPYTDVTADVLSGDELTMPAYDVTVTVTWRDAAVSCSNSVALSKGSEINGTINTISEDDLATCSETASDRQVTVTITPAACYNAPNALTYTGDGTATMQGTKTDNGNGTFSYVYQFAQNDNGSGTFGVTCTAKPAGKTVNFDAGPGISASTSLTEDCAGAGITLPTVNATGVCKGWGTFAGWAEAAVNDSNTTSVTLYTAGSKYTPASDNMTLYAVYSKVKSGSGTVFQSYTLVTEVPSDWSGQYLLSTSTVTATGYDNSNHFSSTSLTPGTTEYASYEFTLTKVGAVGYSIREPSGQYVGWSSGTAFTRTTTAPTTSNTSYLWTPATNGYISNVNTSSRQISYNGSSDFRPYSSPSSGATYLYKRTEGAASVTYYVSDPNCCIELGSINGSVTMGQKSATLSWDLTGAQNGGKDHINSWKVEYKLSSAENWTVAESALAKATLTKTISDLNCNTDYDFRVSANVGNGYCAEAYEVSDQKTTQFTITLTGNGTVIGGAFTVKGEKVASVSACDDDNIAIVATPSTGYNFSAWTITNDDDSDADVTSTMLTGNKPTTASTSFTMPAENVTVTAAFAAQHHNVVFHKNDGSNATDTQDFTYGVAQNLKTISTIGWTRTNYNFGGWMTVSNGSSADKLDGASYTLNAVSDVDLYALWVADNTRTISYSGETHIASYSSKPTTVDIENDDEFSVAFTLDDHYTLSSVAVSMGGEALAAYLISFDQSSLTVTAPAGGFTDNISVAWTIAKTNYTVNWFVNGTKVHDQTDVYNTDYDEVPNDFTSFTDCTDFTFLGWKEGTAIDGGSSASAPSLANVGTKITGNKDYYAVFAEGTPGTTSWTRVTAVNTLTAGGTFILGYEADPTNAKGTIIPMQNTGTLTTSAAGYVYSGDGDESANRNTINMSSISSTSKYEITIAASEEVDGAINIKFGENFLGNENTKNNAKLYAADAATTAFTPTAGSNDAFSLEIVANTGKSDNYKYLKFNTDVNYPRFAVYKTTSENLVFYKKTISAPNFTTWYTTCPHVARVTLSAASVSNGSISFEVNSEAVTNVRTDEGADVNVDVVAEPATGYELTGVALSGTAASHASYDAGVITIDADAEGALTATATFSQKNYSIAVETYPASIGATLGGVTSTAKYGVEQTISTDEPTGYIFGRWYIYDAEDTEKETDLSEEIFTGVYEDEYLEQEASFLMPDKNLVAVAYFDKIYSVSEFAALSKVDGTKYVIEGLICNVESYSNSKYITYDISDNGVNSGTTLKIYKGLGLNGASFSAATDLNVGERVRVYGAWDNSHTDINQDSKLYYHQTLSVASVAIGGSAEKTAYSPSDNTFSFAGLTATATYNTGYVKDVTAEATWTANSANPYTVAATGDVTVRATFGGQYGEETVGVTYTSKTVKEIYLEYESTYTFKGMDLPKPKVYAKYVEEIDDDEITSLVEAANGYDTESAYDKNTPDNYTIKVEYESFNAEYTVQVRKIFDNEDAPHNVADATALIVAGAYQSTTSSTDYMWVRGKVSSQTQYNSSYYISDDGTTTGQLYVFNGKYFNNESFTADTKLPVGDEVIVKATILNYNGNTPELTNSQVTYQLRDPAFAFADVVAGDEFEAGFSADMTVEPTSNEGEAEFTLSSGNTDAVTIVAGKLHAVAEGDAVITASRAATDNTGSINYKAKNATFNVHVIAERTRYAITMDKNGGSGVDPVYDNQLAGATVNLPADNTYSKANSAFDAWVVTETVSGDAVAVTDGHFTMPGAAVTIKATWNEVETCHISFQVSGGEVATAEAPQTVAYSLAEVAHPTVDGFTFLGWSETEYDEETTTLPTIITSYTPAVNEDSKTLYGIYSQVVGSETNKHYVLDYTDDELADVSFSYNEAADVTATDGSEWVIKASKQQSMQINNGKDAYIKVPDCPANIVQIVLTCRSGATNTAAFSETSDGDALVTATGTTTQTLDLSGENVSAGYIIPYSGNCQITHIDVEYSGNVTYYTSSPITRYNVTYAKGDATGVTGVCEAHRYAAGAIILCDAPTCEDKVFAKWSDGSSLYDAGGEYTLSADVTFTATWTAKPTYSVTYNTAGSTGVTPTDANAYLEGAEVTLASASGLSNAGYFFKEWVATYVDGNSDIQTLNIEDGKFTMPAFDVTVTATWARKSSDKWIKVTSTSQLTADKEYIIVNTDATYALGEQKQNNRAAAAIEENNGILTISEAVKIFTLGIPESGKYTFKNGGKYLFASSSNSNYLHEQASNDNNGVWTISINAEGEATVTATGTNSRNIMRYNPNNGSPVFSCYASSSSIQNPVVLYYKAPKIEINNAQNVNASDAAGADIVIHNGGTLTVDNATSIGDLTVEAGGEVTLSSNKLTVVGTFAIESSMATPTQHTSGQLNGATAANFEAAEAYIDITLGAGGTNQQWHAFTVPFPVDVTSGIYDLDGHKLVNETNYAIMEYQGDLRAQGQYGWKKIRTTLVPGTFYIMATDGYRTTYRFKKKAGEPLVAANSKDLAKNAVSGDGEDDVDNGWNGVGNPTLMYGKVGYNAYVLDPDIYDYVAKPANSTNFVVGTPFFIQAEGDGSMSMLAAGEGANYAPARVQAKEIKNVDITFGNEVYTDHLYISASEDALNEYQTGKDLVRLSMNNTPRVGRIFCNAYGHELTMVYAPLVNNKASYELGIFAPTAGTYSISVAAPQENADLYLTKNGHIIWNLTMSPCELELTQGQNNEYGLMLRANVPSVSTDVEGIQPSADSIQKVIIDEEVFILRGGKMYDVTGKEVR